MAVKIIILISQIFVRIKLFNVYKLEKYLIQGKCLIKVSCNYYYQNNNRKEERKEGRERKREERRKEGRRKGRLKNTDSVGYLGAGLLCP